MTCCSPWITSQLRVLSQSPGADARCVSYARGNFGPWRGSRSGLGAEQELSRPYPDPGPPYPPDGDLPQLLVGELVVLGGLPGCGFGLAPRPGFVGSPARHDRPSAAGGSLDPRRTDPSLIREVRERFGRWNNGKRIRGGSLRPP